MSAEAVENSDKLWKCQVDVGLEAPLQIVAGLQQHIPLERMTGLLVVTILNLKPAKLAGQLSEAMILAADHTAADGTVLVRTLCPPEGAQPGDPVRCLQSGNSSRSLCHPWVLRPRTCSSSGKLQETLFLATYVCLLSSPSGCRPAWHSIEGCPSQDYYELSRLAGRHAAGASLTGGAECRYF